MKLSAISTINEFYKKYHLAITLIVGSFLFILSTFWSQVQYIAVVFLLMSYIFSGIEDILCYTCFFMLFSGVIVFYIAIAVGSFVIVFIKYIVDVCKKRVKIYMWPLIATTAIMLFFSLIHYKINEYGFFQGLLIIALFYFVYTIFCYRKQIHVDKLFKSMFLGIFATVIIAFVLNYIPQTKVFIFDSWDYMYVSVHQKIFLIDYYHYSRLMLFTYHPNHLASVCMFLAAYGINAIINKAGKDKKQFALYISMIAISVIVGILTLSKAFLIILVIEYLYGMIYFVKHFKKKSLLLIIPIIIAAGVGCFIFRHQIADIIERLLPNSSSSSLDQITTGRVAIWKKFMNEILSSPLKLIFGEGLYTTDVVDIGPHSIYIAILFRFGIFGIILLAGLVYTYIYSYEGRLNFSLKRVLSILVFMIYSIQEANIDERFLFFVFAIMLLFESKNDNIGDNEINKNLIEAAPVAVDINLEQEITADDGNLETEKF